MLTDIIKEDAASWDKWDAEHRAVLGKHGYKIKQRSYAILTAEKKDAEFHNKVTVSREGFWAQQRTRHSGFSPAEKDKMKAIRQMGGKPDIGAEQFHHGDGAKSLDKHLAKIHKK